MSDANNHFINSLINAVDLENMSLLTPMTAEMLAQYSNDVDPAAAFEDIIPGTPNPFETMQTSPHGIPPKNNPPLQESLNVSQAAALQDSDRLQIIAQPTYGTKLRYRSDYEKNENRLGVMKNKTEKSSYQGPAIRIPQRFRDSQGGYFIQVSLVTIEHHRTNVRYFHPYVLEQPSEKNLDDLNPKPVWIPIENEECITGIKSFSSLRIVKLRASDLKTHGDLREFGFQDSTIQTNPVSRSTNMKDVITEYNLDHTQLAFTVGRQIWQDNQIMIELYPQTTVFSDEMIEGGSKDVDGDSEVPSPNEKPIPSPPLWRIYKYAPRYGFDQSQEEMVIFLTNKPEPKKYGDIQVTFKSTIFGKLWSQIVTDIDLKDRMLAFTTPMCPCKLNEMLPVDVDIQQGNRIIETLKYYYIPLNNQKCSNCLWNVVQNPTRARVDMPNKRGANMLSTIEFNLRDVLVLGAANSLDPEPTASSEPAHESSSSSSNNPSNSPIEPSTTENSDNQIMEKLATSVESLFLRNDYNDFFRVCRAFLRTSPKLVHHAVDNNYIDLLVKFIPTSLNEILQKPNEQGESVLLHAIRLNRFEIIQAILKKSKFEVLLDAKDKNENNLFHLMALHSISIETIQWIINYLRENSIDIIDKFDRFNSDHWTPLQLSIRQNNLPATRHFLPYFKTNICETKMSTGDNLVHLAVRYADLIMVKYLIEDGHLIQQGKLSNLNVTPLELARSLQRNDIVEYFEEKYPQEEIEDDEEEEED